MLFKVKVGLLSKRSSIPPTLQDQASVVGTIPVGTLVNADKVTNVPSTSPGDWYFDGQYYYWGGGLEETVVNETADAMATGSTQAAPVVNWWISRYGINEIWARGITGAGVKIAVLDTGVSLPHADLSGISENNCGDVTQSGTQYMDIDIESHGTHCTGIIKSSSNSSRVTGVAYDSEVFVCKVSRDIDAAAGTVDDDIAYIESGIRWAMERNVHIISISKAISSDYANIEPTLANAVASGILIVAAGGNNDTLNTYNEIFYPAYYSECLSVGAADQTGKLSPMTIVSPRLKLAAPGIEILSTSAKNGYRTLSGSSQATPFVAGVAALAIQYLTQKGKSYTVKGLSDLLLRAGDPIENSNTKIINPLHVLKLIDDGTETNI